MRREFSSTMNEKHVTYSIKTFTQTWYNKQKQDLELMTEKNNSYFVFLLSILKHTIVNQLHMYDVIRYKQDKEQTQENTRGGKKIKKKGDTVHSDFTVLVFV